MASLLFKVNLMMVPIGSVHPLFSLGCSREDMLQKHLVLCVISIYIKFLIASKKKAANENHKVLRKWCFICSFIPITLLWIISNDILLLFYGNSFCLLNHNSQCIKYILILISFLWLVTVLLKLLPVSNSVSLVTFCKLWQLICLN